jgi:hypothetical protein
MKALLFSSLMVVFVSDFISYAKIKMVYYCMRATLLLFCEVGVKQVLTSKGCLPSVSKLLTMGQSKWLPRNKNLKKHLGAARPASLTN